jgi:hypothetical protein
MPLPYQCKLPLLYILALLKDKQIEKTFNIINVLKADNIWDNESARNVLERIQ